ncbi:MAG TPA: LON peptidase substrate-binding domain-containing protein [Candidatus Limnocylindrales bacterium]
MEIPLFPLHTVLCPGIVLPLHVFEERYRALTRHCLATGTPFGVVLIREGREVGDVSVPALAGVGALVEIREAGRYADGRYDLLAAATGRFAIDSVDPGRAPYLVADVTPLEDEVGDETRAERLAATAIRRFVRYLELMRIREGETGDALDIRVELDAPEPGEPGATRAGADAGEGTDPGRLDPDHPVGATGPKSGEEPGLVIPDDPTVLSHLLSGIVQVELPRRQRLLEAATTVERLEQLLVLLDREVFLLGRRLRCFVPDGHASSRARRG